jgi:amino acid adenylation domain-containing protein
MMVSTASPETLADNLAGLLRAAAARAPARTAIITPEETTTYGELWERAESLAAHLLREGLRPGDRVAIFLERCPAAVIAYFGTLAARGVAVIVNENLRPRQLEELLTRSEARLLVTSAEIMRRQPRPPRTGAAILELGPGPLRHDRDPLRPDPLRPDPVPGGGAPAASTSCVSDLAQIIFTSGSTGLPKGVMVSHANLRAAVDVVCAYLGLESADRVASLLPFSSVYGLNQLLCTVRQAATLVVVTSPVPHEAVEAMRREEATVAAAVPPLWLQLLAAPNFAAPPIDSLRILQNAGGHLPEPAVRGLRRLYPHARLFLQYGLTEAIRSTYLPPEEVDVRPNSMGRAIPGAEILVLRDDSTLCAPGEVGELVFRGPTVALGYWDDPAATAQVFRPDPRADPSADRASRVVFTGDLVRKDEHGFLYFVGRRDRMIKTLGYRVGPDEIATVLYASGEVRDALVAGEPDPRRGERIVAYIVLAEDGSLQRLQSFCRLELPRYMQPARYEVRESLPRTSSGKHDLHAVRREAHRG